MEHDLIRKLELLTNNIFYLTGPNAGKEATTGKQQQQRTMGGTRGGRGGRNRFNNGLGNSVRGGRQ